MASDHAEACRIPIGSGAHHLTGDLVIPSDAVAIVVFAHGSGSSRLSPRNRAVAQYLHHRGLATLLLDLLTPAEEQRDVVTREHRFDIAMLGERVIQTLDWLDDRPDASHLPVGCFGASTGAAAALLGAAARAERVGAVVSRGGRPDLAGEALRLVQAPTLLIVGGNDAPVIELNRSAAEKLHCEVRLHIVAGATHLFEEAGAMDEVQRLTADWFLARLAPDAETDPSTPSGT
jgi:dienelactone hydrolase